MVDLRKLTDCELSDLLEKVLNDRDRRQRLASIPQQVTTLTAAFMLDGGEKTIIQNAVISASSQEQVTQIISDDTTTTDLSGSEIIDAPLA